MARFCTGHAFMVLQEVGGDGACFVQRLPGFPRVEKCYPEDVARQWAHLLSLSESEHRSGCVPPVLPELGGCSSFSRLHFDASSGFGVMVSCEGDCAVFDLRDEERALGAVAPGAVALVESGVLWLRASSTNWIRALVEMDDALFHGRMEEHLRDAGSELFQTLRFYQMSEDGRAIEVFGCDFRILKRVVEMMELSLRVEMGPGGALSACEYAFWYPWATDGRVLEGWARAHHHKETDVPARLQEWQERICAASGCRLRVNSVVATHGRTVALRWASDFGSSSQRPHAHATMEAGMKLRELQG